jgi:hypothetical protein
VVALCGIFVLYGGLFVPPQVILTDPQIVPAPESYVAIWLIGVGVLMLVWPRSRREHPGR